jgi:uncharacterized membrane protein
MPEEKVIKPSNGGDNKLLAALGYIITVLIPLFVIFTEKKNDKFLAFHAWQSLILTIAWIIIYAIFFGITTAATVLTAVVGGIGGLIGCLFFPLALVTLISFLLPAWKAYNGEKYLLPVVGEFSQKQVK